MRLRKRLRSHHRHSHWVLYWLTKTASCYPLIHKKTAGYRADNEQFRYTCRSVSYRGRPVVGRSSNQSEIW